MPKPGYTIRTPRQLRDNGYHESATFPVSDGVGGWRTITVWCTHSTCPHTETGAHCPQCQPLIQPHKKP